LIKILNWIPFLRSNLIREKKSIIGNNPKKIKQKTAIIKIIVDKSNEIKLQFIPKKLRYPNSNIKVQR
jgi:hypothetical protein